ncbi:TPA: fatty acid oxidation complex subunit alpha FadB [Escherichia coli]
MYQGQSLRVTLLEDGLAELCFDRQDSAINKFDSGTVAELAQATAAIRAHGGVRGVLLSSAKDSFIVGADIFEFPPLFAGPSEALAAFNAEQNAVFSAFEDLPVPIVAALNGLALGGGFEMLLTADYRMAVSGAQAGLPEVGLGIMPGYGGTVRLPRLVGAATTLDWILSGKPQPTATLLEAGAVDALCNAGSLREQALARLQAVAQDDTWKARREARLRGRRDDSVDFAALKAEHGKRASHYPAPLAVIESVERSLPLARDAALAEENRAFTSLAATPTAQALVQIFINEQSLRKKAKGYTRQAHRLERAAVLGAGIMGGGIAYTSAVRGTPVIMKDIAAAALDTGMGEARKLLAKQVDSGRMPPEKAAAVLDSIQPTLDFTGFSEVDIVVEAIVENLGLKKRVLADVESHLQANAVIASNTSSLSIEAIGSDLQRPQNFAGMHFFNPVPVMPLVEVIKGPATSEETAATVAGYAVAMGKTPVVVKDCPGFLVNRILTAQFVGFVRLIRDGADYLQIDRVMEAFGWPMGPAYLQDVIGMDTSCHVIDVITAGYGERMRLDFAHVIARMVQAGRLGQKSGRGFYRYQADAKGRPQKSIDPEVADLLADVRAERVRDFGDQEIVERMMLPMVIEAALCLEEGVAESAADIDMSLLLGIGFPRHWGGALKYADLVGLPNIVAQCETHRTLGGCYQPTQRMREMAARGERFHPLN